MLRVKNEILKSKRELENVLRRLERRKLGKSYTIGCPTNRCHKAYYQKYRGCAKGLRCKKCWDFFLDDIIIAKKSNVEVYDE